MTTLDQPSQKHTLTSLVYALYLIRTEGQEAAKRVFSYHNEKQVEVLTLVKVWMRRESDFEFLESSVVPEDAEEAISLLKLMRSADEQSYEIINLNKTRHLEGKPPLLIENCVHSSSIEELTFIEELFDEEILDQLVIKLGKPCASIIQELLVIQNKHLRCFVDRYLSVMRSESLPPESERSWLTYPCHACKIDSWALHLNHDQLTNQNKAQSMIEHCLNELHKEWAELWQIHEWSDGITWQGESGQAAAHAIWGELMEPYLRESASMWVLRERNSDLIEDLNTCFISLIDARRPKDQRIGSFWINELDPRHITVMFLTRDGKLLAQRDLKWDPKNPESILTAFEIINIRLLTYPQGLEFKYPSAFKVLKGSYSLYPVSSLVLDPVPHPQSLTLDAQKALRIGQRFVAPLRFWARTDLLELMRSMSAPPVFDCLERSNKLDHLLHTLKDTCSERWLRLRKTRSHRQKTSSYHFPQDRENLHRNQSVEIDREDDDLTEIQYNRGQVVEIRVLKKEGRDLLVETVLHAQKGTLRLPSRHIQKPRLQQIISVYVLAHNLNTGELSFSIERVEKLEESTPRKETSPSISEENDQTIDRLNAMFSKSTPDKASKHSVPQRSPKTKRRKSS